MLNSIIQTTHPVVQPLPAANVSIRPGVLGDVPFIDSLQKLHSRSVGFMWDKAIKGHIAKGNVLVAQAHDGQMAGYVLGVDRYMKRDELGVIYQINVRPEYQRSLVAAHLLKAKFEASAYGCRLYCCWCAQDLERASRFWEAMGFVPLAFRTGGGRNKGFDADGKYRGRMHIFWQKRIRAGDVGDVSRGGTAYWFPSITGAGAIGEDRIVLPIPPGTHWSDAKPIVLPHGERSGAATEEAKLLDHEAQRLERQYKEAVKKQQASKAGVVERVKTVESGGLRFARPQQAAAVEGAGVMDARATAAKVKEAKRAAKQAKKKFDPVQESFARELKDRWLEEVVARPELIATGREKYAVGRLLEGVGAGVQAGGVGDGGVIEAGDVKRLAA